MKKGRNKILLFLLIVLLMAPVAGCFTVRAETSNEDPSEGQEQRVRRIWEIAEADIQDFYIPNGGILSRDSIFKNMFRSLGWSIIKLSHWIAARLETLYDSVIGLVDFTSWGKLGEVIDGLEIISFAVLVLSLVAIGIMYLLRTERPPDLLKNIVMALLVLSLSTWGFSTLNKLTINLKGAINSAGAETEAGGSIASNADQIVSANILDLVTFTLESEGGLKDLSPETASVVKRYTMNEQQIDLIEINDRLIPDAGDDGGIIDTIENVRGSEIADEYKRLIGHGLQPAGVQAGGQAMYRFAEFDTTWPFGWFLENLYYRYDFDFLTIVVELLCLAFVYFALSYKVLRTIFELGIKRVLATVYAMELSGGAKLRMILADIRDSYIILLMTTLMLRFYTLFTTFLAEKSSITGLARLIILVFIALAVSDGPDLIIRLLNQDVGLKRAGTTLFAAGHLLARTGGRLMYGKNHADGGIVGAIKKMRAGSASASGSGSGASGGGAGTGSGAGGPAGGGSSGRSGRAHGRSGSSSGSGAGSGSGSPSSGPGASSGSGGSSGGSGAGGPAGGGSSGRSGGSHRRSGSSSGSGAGSGSGSPSSGPGASSGSGGSSGGSGTASTGRRPGASGPNPANAGNDRFAGDVTFKGSRYKQSPSGILLPSDSVTPKEKTAGVMPRQPDASSNADQIPAADNAGPANGDKKDIIDASEKPVPGPINANADKDKQAASPDTSQVRLDDNRQPKPAESDAPKRSKVFDLPMRGDRFSGEVTLKSSMGSLKDRHDVPSDQDKQTTLSGKEK